MTTTVSTHSENRWVDLNTFVNVPAFPCVAPATGIKMVA